MKGAMAMEIIPKSRYPGDPQGQACASGRGPRAVNVQTLSRALRLADATGGMLFSEVEP